MYHHTEIAPYETVDEYTRETEGYIEHTRIRQMGDDQYPSGYDYTMHYGRTDAETLLRYDKAHERMYGHDNGDAVTEIKFPSIVDLFDRFQREIDDLPP